MIHKSHFIFNDHLFSRTFCCYEDKPCHISDASRAIFIYCFVLEFDFSPNQVEFIVKC
jgi:hypothetical protein